MEKLRIESRLNHPLKLAALLHGRARAHFVALRRPDIADAIRSVRFTGTAFVVTTGIATANAEVSLYAADLSIALCETLRAAGAYALDEPLPIRYA